MCGISVVINGTRKEIETMTMAIRHRGKSDHITEIDNIKVGFNYLPITGNDPRPQPYKAGKYSVWLNGYISNYKELALKYNIELENDCDTELLAKFIEIFKYSKLLELNGFFSVVAYDGETLEAFTDRYGIKQLYTYRAGDRTYVSSECKGILSILNTGISEHGISDWKYSLGVMNRNGTIYSGIEKIRALPMPHIETLHIPYNEATQRLRLLLDKSFDRNKSKVLKDCVMLSGGVDSGIIAKYMNPNYSFSMDYIDEKYSEIKNIKLNSKGIHYTMICNEELAKHYSIKTADVLCDPRVGSCYTNYALMELASKFATVVYSGAGSDEIFNGYTHRYNKPVNDVIKRTDHKKTKDFNITHKEYDWSFLRGILTVEDRMSGAFAMEARYPFLDNDIVDFVLSLPEEYLTNKKILKDVSGLNIEVIDSPKKGFSNPYFTNTEWVDFIINNSKFIQHGRHL